MKILTLILFGVHALACSALAQSTNNPPVSTNNVQVVLKADQDALLRASWRYDNSLRTNSPPLAPYTNTLPAQTFKDYMQDIVSEALVVRAEQIRGTRQNEMERRFRDAPIAKQNAALRALQ